MNDRVDPEEVRHIATLARIDLTDDEVDTFADQFGDVLDYFETLEEVPAIDSDPDLVNVLRTDEITESLNRDDALRNAEDTEDGYFKGPPVG